MPGPGDPTEDAERGDRPSPFADDEQDAPPAISAVDADGTLLAGLPANKAAWNEAWEEATEAPLIAAALSGTFSLAHCLASNEVEEAQSVKAAEAAPACVATWRGDATRLLALAIPIAVSFLASPPAWACLGGLTSDQEHQRDPTRPGGQPSSACFPVPCPTLYVQGRPAVPVHQPAPCPASKHSPASTRPPLPAGHQPAELLCQRGGRVVRGSAGQPAAVGRSAGLLCVQRHWWVEVEPLAPALPACWGGNCSAGLQGLQGTAWHQTRPTPPAWRPARSTPAAHPDTPLLCLGGLPACTWRHGLADCRPSTLQLGKRPSLQASQS